MTQPFQAPQFESGIIADTQAKLLNMLMRVVYGAGQVTKREFLLAEEKGSFDLVSKADGSPVTRIDFATTDALETGFRAEGIDAYLDDEERQSGNEGNRVVIVTDPVDGTQNLALGLKGFFTNVCGKYIDGELVASIVNDPMNDEMFVAGKGAGTWKFNLEKTGVWRAKHLTMSDLCADPEKRPFLLTDTKVYEEDRILAKALEILGYRPEPVSGSGKKMALLVSRPNVVGMLRSQRGNPDPHDIAAAALFVTEAGGLSTSLGGKTLLDANLKFYDGYAFGTSSVHRDILIAHHTIQELLAAIGSSDEKLTKTQSNELAQTAAAVVRSRFYPEEKK